MVPVFVVGVMGASLANCVLAVAAYLKDKLAYEASGGRGVSGDKESIPASACCMPQRLSLISLSPSCLHGYSHGYLFKSQCPCDNANASQSLFPSFFFFFKTSVGVSLAHLYHPSDLGPLFSPGGQREQQTSCMGS